MARAARRQAGMSLIEVMVSLLVFSVAGLGLLGLQAQALRESVDAEDRGRAALLANEIVASMWFGKTVTLPADTFDAWTRRLQDTAVSGLPNARGTVVTAIADGVNVATITITWRTPARSPSEPPSSYITQVAIP